MTARLTFVLEGRPVSKGRPRTRIGIKTPARPFPLQLTNPASWRSLVKASTWAQIHPDPKSAAYESAVQGAAWRAWNRQGKPKLTGPYRIDVVVVLARPKRLKEGPRCWLDSKAKPDVNNVCAAIFDALQAPCVLPGGGDGPGLIDDDARVCWQVARKCYAASDEGPRIEVEIRELPALGEVTDA